MKSAAALACGALAACSVALAGCRSSSGVPPTTSTTLTSAELVTSTNDDAVMRVTTARCDRELSCNKIGQGRAYEDQPTCLDQIGELMDEEAGQSTCPRGVDAFAVSACLLDIQRTACGGALEQSTNLPSCTKAFLCAH